VNLKFCSHVEMQMITLCILSEFVMAVECRYLIRECPTVVPFTIAAYRNARSQLDHRTALYTFSYDSFSLIRLLWNLIFADESVVERVVDEGGLADISAAFQMDPNLYVPGGSLLNDGLFGIQTLFQILVAEKGKHVERVRRDRDLLAGVRNSSFYIFSSQMKTTINLYHQLLISWSLSVNIFNGKIKENLSLVIFLFIWNRPWKVDRKETWSEIN